VTDDQSAPDDVVILDAWPGTVPEAPPTTLSLVAATLFALSLAAVTVVLTLWLCETYLGAS
jgi:uncharacterized protein involved in exopolysaccharide biosynthesis